MRREQKRQAEDFVELLGQAHDKIRKEIDRKNIAAAMELLAQCQEGAIQLGGLIEATEGEGFVTIPLLESYCELAYGIHEELSGAAEGNAVSGNKFYKKLRNALLHIENSIRHDIKVRLEIVFFPYKSSMWDSLESVWREAEADPDCDAYVVPIPYYDRNKDGSLGTYHYEGGSLPEYVPVVYYENYRLESRKPDIAYIHNPYDQGNYVTSIDPGFYSAEIKKHVDKLVYIPYYSTSGGMSEAQERCMAYYYADYIVIQAPKYRKFFDPALPDGKFLPFGSPKFDRVIRMCGQPEPVPEAWSDRMKGRKVYFYNTSINGMLADTPRFLKKMAYVFRCFQGREDACLMWRPHPLLESTFASLRPEYKPSYDKLKKLFLDRNLGIYDDTPDISKTISHCDVYLGDSATSVTSLFGMAGKPLFIFNNNIDKGPEEGDWRGEIVRGFQADCDNAWMITQGNKLYHSPKKDFRYEYCCNLSEYDSGLYYIKVVEIAGRTYVCPGSAQDILVVEEGKISRRIPLERHVEQGWAFGAVWGIDRYLFLIPLHYPAIVRYDTVLDKVDYIRGYNDVFISMVDGSWRVGGSCTWREFLMIASPVDGRILAIDSKTGRAGVLDTGVADSGGCIGMFFDGRDLWMLPYSGTMIIRWNPEKGMARTYTNLPEGFRCREIPKEIDTMERPFGSAAFSERHVYLAPCWGNMFLRIDRESGDIQEWQPPFPVLEKEKNGYFVVGTRGYFFFSGERFGEEHFGAELSDKEFSDKEFSGEKPSGETHSGKWHYFSAFDRKLYRIDLETEAYEEVSVEFDEAQLREHAGGFCEVSEWLQYACEENAFHSLEALLDGRLPGRPFDKERQLAAYGRVAASSDGNCGKRVHQFVCESLR